jgi:hypothetical protein
MTSINKLKKLVLLQEKEKNLYLYPNCIIFPNYIIPKKYTLLEIEKIKSKFKLLKDINICETYFKDLVCYKDKDKNTNTYFRKSSQCSLVKNYMLLSTILKPISEDEFPLLSTYHHTETKFLEIFELNTINIIITKQDENYTICFEIKNKHEFDKEINIILKYF